MESGIFFTKDGTLKYKLEYADGVTKDRRMDIDESDYLDLLEKKQGKKLPTPKKTGVVW